MRLNIKSHWELYKAPAQRRAPVTSRCNEPKPVRERKRLRSEGALGHASNTRSTPTTSKAAPPRTATGPQPKRPIPPRVALRGQP